MASPLLIGTGADGAKPAILAVEHRQEPVKAARLEFLDGIRGVAALMVVVTHVSAYSLAPSLVVSAALGNPWVSIFITLSGFCLYLPAARLDSVRMPRSFWDFMRRRAQRILPAWYASLVLCMAIGWLLYALNWHGPFEAFLPRDWLDLAAHITLLHSMTQYSGSINGPGYTLGTEWQLYVLMFPFLWVARRWGWLTLLTLVGLFALPYPGLFGNLLHKIFSPTFTGPFVIGMIAARLIFKWPATSVSERVLKRAEQALVVTVVIAILAYFQANTFDHDLASWMAAIATGAGCILMARQPLSLSARLFGSGVGKTLGSFAYSLYLTHFPLLALTTAIAANVGVTSKGMFYDGIVPALPLIVVFAYLFHRIFERPFMPARHDASSQSATSVRSTFQLLRRASGRPS